MSTAERRPLLYHRNSRLSRQPSPERILSYRKPSHPGRSNDIQSTINTINVLIGVGLLSLPLAMRNAGWISGFILLTFSALITNYTGHLLARCMDTHPSLNTYVDVAGASFGPRGQILTSLLFSLNMVAACVALVILFGDTMTLLVPGLSSVQWKMVCGVVVVPMQFVDFRVLAPVSVVGVVSCFAIVVLVVLAGLINPTGPGSLVDPALTSWTPASWSSLCASIGLFMSPWGANASFPTFYRDMKQPKSYGGCLNRAYVVTFLVDIAMAACGYLMFGAQTVEEITYNILSLSPRPYPHALLVWLIGFTAIMPVTKITLSSRPLIIMIEQSVFGIDTGEGQDDQADTLEVGPAQKSLHPRRPFTYHICRILVRIFVIALIVGVSVLVPDFDRVISLMGSALCYAISVVLPLLFHIKLMGEDSGRSQRILDWILAVLGCAMAILGTAAALI